MDTLALDKLTDDEAVDVIEYLIRRIPQHRAKIILNKIQETQQLDLSNLLSEIKLLRENLFN